MGSVSHLRIALLSVLLAGTVIMSNLPAKNGEVAGRPGSTLRQAFAALPDWHVTAGIPLPPRVVEELRVDDYLYQVFRREEDEVTLYVGLYRGAAKVGAAHDPLVCFQGQGWKLRDRERGRLVISGTPGLAISYAAMIAERQEEAELVVYWFQANGRTAPGTLLQKLHLVWERLAGRGEGNAFVRISAPLGNQEPEQVKERIRSFMAGFYPRFHHYLVESL